MSFKRVGLIASMLAGALVASTALAGTLVINTDTSDPAPKAAFTKLIDGFKAKNPGVEVKWNRQPHGALRESQVV
jgi:multiple sugar transport system substrate-binding protein